MTRDRKVIDQLGGLQLVLNLFLGKMNKEQTTKGNIGLFR